MVEYQTEIEIRSGCFGYIKRGTLLTILHHISLGFITGDFIGIVGLNGVGKSTFLRSLCGLQPLLKGSVFIEGKNINEMEPVQLARKVSIVLTERIGGFNLTAYDVVAAGQLPYTDSFHRISVDHQKIILSAIERTGIGAHIHKPVSELSDGLFQKTMIAKSLAQQTPIMLLDEPSAFLDYASKHELFTLLRQLADHDRKCILVSSHDLNIVLRYCNKLLIIANGEAEIIPVNKAMDHERFRAIGGNYL
jgi:iron complex transport system ATP-binding protein